MIVFLCILFSFIISQYSRGWFLWSYVCHVCLCLQTSSLVLIISFIVLYIKLNFFFYLLLLEFLAILYLLYIFHLEIFALNENNFSNIASIWWPNFFFLIPLAYKLVLYIWLSCCVEKNEVREFLNSINVITWSENIIFFCVCCSFLLFTFYLKMDMLIAYMKKVRYKYYVYVLSILLSLF